MATYRKAVKTLEEMIEIQCSSGNWNYDSYMHGMANGMIFALSLFKGGRPEYLDQPKQWLADMPNRKPELNKE